MTADHKSQKLDFLLAISILFLCNIPPLHETPPQPPPKKPCSTLQILTLCASKLFHPDRGYYIYAHALTMH